MSPVTRAAMPEIPEVAFAIGATGPGPRPPRATKTRNNTLSKMLAAARPTDHLPNLDKPEPKVGAKIFSFGPRVS